MDWNILPKELECSTQDIGKGQYGVVRIARWRGTPVAVKTFHSCIAEESILREFNIMVLLHHPNIVQTLGYINPPFSIVMEYVHGMDLDTLVAKRPRLGSITRLSIMKQVLCAIAYLHGRRPEMMIHRDIKPSNILINTVSMQVKLGDFGVSKLVRINKKTSSSLSLDTAEKDLTQRVGTLRYMAPEVYDPSNPTEYTNKVDIWSAAMVFYLLWENHPPPFPDIGMKKLHGIISEGYRPAFFQTPSALQRLISMGWRASAERRPKALRWLTEVEKLKRQWIYDARLAFSIK